MPNSKTFYLETYGCAFNKSDSEILSGFLKQHKFSPAPPEKARYIIINSCAVKEPTEKRMLWRIGELQKTAEKSGAELIVYGCLPKINSKAISEISGEITQIGPDLGELADYLHLHPAQNELEIPEERANRFISIIPICKGCLQNCAYCCTKFARGKLKSQGIEAINKRFQRAIKKTSEIWLTAQDCAAYGADIKTGLAELLGALLQNRGNYRIRIGMMNPQHLLKIYGEFAEVFDSPRIYKFLHVPLQSGSDRILKLMGRGYRADDFLGLAKKLKKEFPELSLSTDIIVGFPSETESDFRKTIETIEKIRPDIVNISKFGARPGTRAKEMELQVDGAIINRRSALLSRICREIGLETNREMIGKKARVLVSGKGSKSGFIGRAENYKPVLLRKNLLGKFANVKITGARQNYLECKLI
ncbi:MAG: tRNA (N(6)-L-threonylcarbamoyladenosine(37)-C(2))-methylthiotransferase [Candidatus Diapherotrites archaeon]|nr:tRNA (N(6)-L-threonylcarbamoyladenosine(37)-C(2))-methylthiotransferase [Candidatus Diapherotrites archaeon]